MCAEAISVIVPAHNGAVFYSDAIDSILLQQWSSLEIIVVDDGSTDDLEKRIAKCGIAVKYLRQERKGPAVARNSGLRRASSNLIAFLDIDDRWANGHLVGLNQALRENQQAGIAQGLMKQFTELADGRCLVSGAYRMPYLGSCLFRRRVFEQCGTFDEAMQMGEDYDLMFRCWENDIPKQCVDQVSLLYRRHSGNMTRGKNGQSNLQVLARRMRRIRCGAADPNARRRFPFAEYIGDIRNFSNAAFESTDQWTLSSAS